MKAQNLTLSVPYKGCDKNCPYCISHITWSPEIDLNLLSRNIQKVKKLADAAAVTNVMITSKGEPFLNLDCIYMFCENFQNYPLEIQTNGIWLSKCSIAERVCTLRDLYKFGLNTIAFSIDKLSDLQRYKIMFEDVVQEKINVRVCINVTGLLENTTCTGILREIFKLKTISQVLFRNITKPVYVDRHTSAIDWINSNVPKEIYEKIQKQFMVEVIHKQPVRILSFGMPIYSYEGISIAFSDYCIQDTHNQDDIRSLIYHQDGHLYTSWADRGSILF